jgi:hypothetical protein
MPMRTGCCKASREPGAHSGKKVKVATRTLSGQRLLPAENTLIKKAKLLLSAPPASPRLI